MDFSIDDPGDDFATLVIRLDEDDSASALLEGSRGGTLIRLPLYDYEARNLIATLEEFPTGNEEDDLRPWPPEGTCILYGVEGEDPDDCSTHEHERIMPKSKA